MATEDRNFTHSTLRERIVEHVFVGDVLRTLWRRGVTDVEILRPEFDAHGYDVVMSRGPVVRHVQLKTQAAGKVSVGRALAEKPSGCVVWIGLNSIRIHWNWVLSCGSAALLAYLCPTSLLTRIPSVRPTMQRACAPCARIITNFRQQLSRS
jgi:hypothetical protein